MKRLGDFLISPHGSTEIVMGNTAIVRGMIESGVRVVTSYPGSPTPEIAAAITAISKDKNPLYFEFSTNEKVATEVAFGASINGHLSTVFFKSVGLNVAADTFVQLGHMEVIGGMVIVIGDDPGANSSQNEQDNRHYARLAYVPMLEPSTPTEAYTMFKKAAQLSIERYMPVILRMTTHVCHAKEKVTFSSWTPLPLNHSSRFNVDNGPYIPLTTKLVLPLKRRALEKLAQFAADADTSSLNTVINNNNPLYGIITMGAPFQSLQDVLEETALKPDILKLGIIHPLPKQLVADFLRQHKEVKIVEELDDFIEQQVKALAYDMDISTKIIGKQDYEDWLNEYTPEKVSTILQKTWPHLLADKKPRIPLFHWSPRPAQLCPGCGHRSAFHAIKQALDPNDITVADIGCHTLGIMEPYNMGQVLLCMGHSSGTAAGLSLFNNSRKVVAFLGDSTFFHAGLPGIINAVFNHHNFTLILLDNGTTAMTGHQSHPGVGYNVNGPTEKITIRRVLDGIGITNIREIDAYAQAQLTEAVKAALTEKGFKVIIAKHPCMLKAMRERNAAGKPLPPSVEITTDCNQNYTCVSAFACPTFQHNDDGSIIVHKDLCIGDGSCKQTCPTKAILHKRPKKEDNS
ncbi:thiamine pyrophosphate-dependent enzyme [Pelosinus fermentans]|uniref:Indolepyruvate oxidoreductase subunit IorA n=1 Tax=Pelosinus fermentans JBW45 TaxID=1192197 RepID=I8U5W9_9FIRM|nr:thiamine pyrophosphate-dependent enzyme [Pelosinus fermentans]AJQ27897.1 Indolepyruvate ferredoxin oxidoreductase [Pelosinus fermentans JBW45]